jgi:hypothetical protein
MGNVKNDNRKKKGGYWFWGVVNEHGRPGGLSGLVSDYLNGLSVCTGKISIKRAERER